jgi:3-hydroxyisobutyrate dehydrogenase-like beta-hydroxyacid dehydrogenase
VAALLHEPTHGLGSQHKAKPGDHPVSTRTYETQPRRKLAFLGLGVMGHPMAGHLAGAGHQVTVYNRTASKAQAWANEFTGAHAATPREAAAGAELVFACVGNDDDLRSVTLGPDGAFAGMQGGAVFIDHTTASAEVARELYAAAQAKGLHFIDAPVSGGQAGAVNGALTVMCGGDAAPFETMKPSPRTRQGGHAHRRQRCRSSRQDGQPGGPLPACCKGCQRHRLRPRRRPGHARVLDVIGKGAAQSWQMDNRERRWSKACSTSALLSTDAQGPGLVLDEARRNGAVLPVTAVVDQFSATYRPWAANAGKRRA